MDLKRTVRFADSPLPTPKGVSAPPLPETSNVADAVQETVEVKQLESQKDLGYKSLRNNYKVKKKTPSLPVLPTNHALPKNLLTKFRLSD